MSKKRSKKNVNNINNNTNIPKNNDENDSFDLSVTKQQQFDFGDLDLTSTLDTSFTSKKGSNKVSKESDDKFQYLEKYVQKSNNSFIVWILVIIIVLLSSFLIFHYLTFNHSKVKVVNKEKKEKVVNVIDDNYLFLGDSITDYYDLNKYYEGMNVVNSGISGNTTGDILADMNNRVYKYNPSKVFLLIGTNDIQRKISEDEIISNIEEIIEKIKDNRSYAKIYLQSIYPVDEEKDGAQDRENSKIKSVNKKLEDYCKDNDVTYIDLFSKLIDNESSDVKIDEDYSDDGLHLTSEGYEVVTEELKKYMD